MTTIRYRIEARLPRVMTGRVDLTPGLLVLGYAIRDRVNVYPKRRHGHMRWRSLRQKRYVLANVSLPYRRRGYLAKQWTVTPTPPARVVVRNSAPYARFVIGLDQQPFHQDTGWRRIDTETRAVSQDRSIMRDVETAIKRSMR